MRRPPCHNQPVDAGRREGQGWTKRGLGDGGDRGSVCAEVGGETLLKGRHKRGTVRIPMRFIDPLEIGHNLLQVR